MAGRSVARLAGKASPWGFIRLSWGIDWGNVHFISFELMQRSGWSVLEDNRRRGHYIFTDTMVHTCILQENSSHQAKKQYLNISVRLWSQRSSSSMTSSTLPEIEAASEGQKLNTPFIGLSIIIIPTNWTTGLCFSSTTVQKVDSSAMDSR